MIKGKILVPATLVFLIVTSKLLSQPAISKQNIPKNIPADVKTKIEALYSTNPVARATAAYELGELTPESHPAIPFLVKLLGDDVLIDPLPYDQPNWSSSPQRPQLLSESKYPSTSSSVGIFPGIISSLVSLEMQEYFAQQ